MADNDQPESPIADPELNEELDEVVEFPEPFFLVNFFFNFQRKKISFNYLIYKRKYLKKITKFVLAYPRKTGFHRNL